MDIYTFSLEPFTKFENGKRLIDDRFNFKTAKIKRMTTLQEYGLPSNWHGGNVAKIAELQGEPLFIFVNIDGVTLDVGVKKENLNKLKPETLEVLKKKYPDLVIDKKPRNA